MSDLTMRTAVELDAILSLARVHINMHGPSAAIFMSGGYEIEWHLVALEGSELWHLEVLITPGDDQDQMLPEGLQIGCYPMELNRLTADFYHIQDGAGLRNDWVWACPMGIYDAGEYFLTARYHPPYLSQFIVICE